MKKLSVYLATLFSFAFIANAEVPSFVFDGSNIDIYGQYIGVVEDPSGRLTIDDVKVLNTFKASNQKVPNLMISKSTFWTKVKIENHFDEERLLLEYAYPIVDLADLYIVSEDGSIQHQKLGEEVPISARKYKYPSFIYDVTIPKGDSKTIYLKIRNGQQIMVPLKIGTKEGIFNDISSKDIFSSIYAGIILVMFLYNLFIFFATRDKSYAFYTAYIILAGITHVSYHGYSYKLLWPSFPLLSELSVALSPAVVGIAGALFVKDFLRTRVYSMKLHRVFDVLLVLYTVCIGLYAFGLHQISYQMSQGTALILAIAIITTSAYVAHRGYRPARYFFMAFTIFMTSIVIFIMKDFGVLPYNMLTVYCLEIGSALELVLLSFALADKINIMRMEKEESQAKALEALRENERMVKEQNVVLETKVKERTVELEESNDHLNTTLTELKEAQSQLVDAEKMASLGQLTAGIAHEINNPINFVVSNINPLKRDVEDIMEILNKYAEIRDEKDLKARLDEIEELKEELDLDYLTDEIGLLLNGIDDGANRTAEIVKGLKTFSRLDETDLKKADINEGIESTLVLLNNSISNKIKIIKDLEPFDPIDCYAGKLNQLFMNILKNAQQAVEAKQYPEGIKPEITIITRDLEDTVAIRVIDNGIGINEDTKKKIFEPFFTTKEVGEGTGLGLSIAYNIIEKHNGIIEVESEEGKGTEFIIILPKYHSAEGGPVKNRVELLKKERRERIVKDRSPDNVSNHGDQT